MNRKVLICAWVFAVLTSASSNAYACGLPPIASLYLSNKPCDPVTHRYYAQVGEIIILDGSDSNDPDGGDPNLASTHYIKKFYFNFGDGSSYYETPTYHPDGGFDGGTWHTYTAPILCSPALTVTDNDAGNDPAERRPPDKSASCSCSLAVVKVNLNLACVPDDYREENPCGIVLVNDDDDNDNGIADKDEAPVNSENDLIAISLSILPANLNRGEVELKVPGENAPLRVWKYPDKQELIIPSNDPCHPSYCERWAPSELPPTLYVEGLGATLPGGTRLTLSYIIDQLGCIHQDFVCITVGCNSAGPHDSSVHWINPDDDYYSLTVPPFGEFTFSPATSPATIPDVDFRYDNCTWVCEISNVVAKTTILVRHPATLLPDRVSVSQASDVPCNEVILAMFDLHDTDLTDDIGAPRSKYWCHTASCQHETKHRTDWQGFYGEKLAIAIECIESFCESNIDCGDPNTISCQAAKNYWQDWIQEQFNEAYDDARKAMDDPSTPLIECEVPAYLVSYEYENAIYALLPEGCTP